MYTLYSLLACCCCIILNLLQSFVLEREIRLSTWFYICLSVHLSVHNNSFTGLNNY